MVEYNDKNWKEILANNKLMAEFIGVEPEIEYAIGDKEGTCFHPKSLGYSSVVIQKIECDKWLKENETRAHGCSLITKAHYPRYDRDLNVLFDLMNVLQKEHFAEVEYFGVGGSVHRVCLYCRAKQLDNRPIATIKTSVDLQTAYYYAILLYIQKLIKSKELNTGTAPDIKNEAPNERN